MFGSLRPSWKMLRQAGCAESVCQGMCGVCACMQSRYGRSARVALNHDVIFMSLIAAGTDGHPPRTMPWPLRRCLSSSWTGRWPIGEYLASLAQYMALLRVADGIRDGDWRGLKRLQSRIPGRIAAVESDLAAAGLDVEITRDCLRRTQQVESSQCTGAFDELSAPTADAYAAAFDVIARITGTSDSQLLSQVGTLYGRATLLADAIEDHDEDRRRGSYNVLEFAHDMHCAGRLDLARAALDERLQELEALCRGLSPTVATYATAVRRRMHNRPVKRRRRPRAMALYSVAPALGACFEYDPCQDKWVVTPTGVFAIIACIAICVCCCKD